jgi:hypothetical protein
MSLSLFEKLGLYQQFISANSGYQPVKSSKGSPNGQFL